MLRSDASCLTSASHTPTTATVHSATHPRGPALSRLRTWALATAHSALLLQCDPGAAAAFLPEDDDTSSPPRVPSVETPPAPPPRTPPDHAAVKSSLTVAQEVRKAASGMDAASASVRRSAAPSEVSITRFSTAVTLAAASAAASAATSEVGASMEDEDASASKSAEEEEVLEAELARSLNSAMRSSPRSLSSASRSAARPYAVRGVSALRVELRFGGKVG